MRSRPLFSLFILLCLIGCAFSGTAQVVTGHISDTQGEALPFVSVYLKNSTYGVSANQKGDYRLQVKPGSYTLVFSLVGYEKQEFPIQVKPGQTLSQDVVLREKTELRALEIYADKRDIAREVLSEVRERRKGYHDRMQPVRFRTYAKASLEKDPDKPESDSLKTEANLEAHFKRQNLNLIESVSEVCISGSSVRENILAFHDYADTKSYSEGVVVRGQGLGEQDIAPPSGEGNNPYLITSLKGFTEYDFYENLIPLPGLCEKPLLSPIGAGSALSYRYELESTFYEENRKIYQIRVDPIFRTEALFQGILFIEDSTFALKAVDLTINPAALYFHSNFRIQQNYREMEPGIYFPYRRELTYTIREGKTRIYGNTYIDHHQVQFKPEFLPKTFSSEVQHYDDLAFDRDSSFWHAERRINMKENELAYIAKTDSLRRVYNDSAYIAKRDSAFNHITFWDVTLSGMGFRNREKGYTLYINPLIAQMVFYGIGGYRHRLGGTFTKNFNNGRDLELEGDIDYGFNNKDVRGKAGIGYTYIPKKFVRTFIRVGDFYDMINTYASLGSVFSRSNYVRAQTFSVAQRMEIVNGLFGELSFEFSDQQPISNLKQDSWSSDLFGEVNQPIDFTRYVKSELKLEFKYRPFQKYLIKRNRKIIIGSNWPEFSLVYRKGIPNLFRSEVNFDFIEFGARQQRKLGRWGEMNWSVLTGTFFNQKSLRILEHRYFRGSDAFFFSDPTRSFQLLGPTLSTANAFVRANYIHQFNGLILNKIPLINRLKLTEAAGGGMLMVPEKDFRHAELFFGLQKVVRIRKQLFRIGLYGVTADSSLQNPVFTWKIGVNFFNTFNGSWSY